MILSNPALSIQKICAIAGAKGAYAHVAGILPAEGGWPDLRSKFQGQ